MSDHDREWIIGCIKHDGFIKTDRFDKANHIILDALEKDIDAEITRLSRPTDLISRADAIDALSRSSIYAWSTEQDLVAHSWAIRILQSLPSADAVTHDLRTETHGVCLISKADAMGAVQDHFNANGFKGYDDGQKMMDRIKALPSAELPKGDLISRRWLLDLYGDYIGDNGDTKYHVPLEVVRQNIIDAPSADAEQGEWIEREDLNGDYYYDCSVCGESFVLCDGTPSMNLYHFCPNCGADMRGEKNGDK